MNIITLLQPQRIVFGDGCSPQCAEFLAQQGRKRVLLVTAAAILPFLDDLRSAFKKANLEVIIAPFFTAEPTISDFQRVCDFARSQHVDSVAGIGGGSVIDIAKLVAALADGKQSVTEVFGINLLKSRALPLVCLPTTAGTGAEVSPNAILLDEGDELKKGVVSPHLVPD
ncbi:MAG TPA: iron-containing alcohol dehydrogenase, partial [Verrucomicrobiae bacterium]